MISVDEAKQKAAQHFERHYRNWIADLVKQALELATKEDAPVEFSLPLHPPTEQAVLSDSAKARKWVQGWRTNKHSNNVAWKTVEWKSVGRQNIPTRLTLSSPEEIAAFISRQTEWNCIKERSLKIAECWVKDWCSQHCVSDRHNESQGANTNISANIAGAIAKIITKISVLSEANWNIYLQVLDWLIKNPNTHVYVRQLPIRGIDSKWLEQHRGILEPPYGAMTGKHGFPFLKAPKQFRVKILDQNIAPSEIEDLTLSPKELSKLSKLPKLVFICENLVSVLSFPQVARSIAIHGSGYAVSALAEIEWLENVPIIYWGDLDSNGFAILNQLRHHHDNVTSMMMDQETLAKHRELCVVEEKPNTGTFDRLTKEEQETLRVLLTGDTALRLEQERIGWQYATAKIAETANAALN